MQATNTERKSVRGEGNEAEDIEDQEQEVMCYLKYKKDRDKKNKKKKKKRFAVGRIRTARTWTRIRTRTSRRTRRK